MAKRSATPSSSRPAVTATPTKHRTVGRTTRAQSRELSEAPASAQKRARHVDAEDTATTTRRSRRQRTHEPDEPTQNRKLAAVEEAQEPPSDGGGDGEIIHARSSILPRQRDSPDIAEQSAEDDQAPSVDIIDEEAKDIDVNAIPQALELLDGATNRLLALLLSTSSHARVRDWKALADPDSPESRRLRRDFKLFELQREELAREDYIRPEAVRKAIRLRNSADLEHDLGESWIPDPIVRKANLVRMIHDVLLSARRSPDGQPSLAQLESVEHIFNEVIGASKPLVRSAVAVNFSIIVQCVVAHAEANPSEAAHAVFARYLHSTDGSRPFSKFLKRFDLSEMSEQALKVAINELYGYLNHCASMTLEELVSDLPKDWRWETFEDKLLKFAAVRQIELDNRLDSLGGTQAVIQNIESIIAAADESNKRSSLHAKLAQGSSWRHKRPAKSVTDVLRRKGKAPATAQHAEPQSRPQQRQQQQPTSTIPKPSVASQNKSPTHQRQSHHQSHAPRPIEHEDESVQSDGGHARDDGNDHLFVGQLPGQIDDHIAADFDDIEPTQDRGFQTDHRASTMASQRRQALREMQQASRPSAANQDDRYASAAALHTGSSRIPIHNSSQYPGIGLEAALAVNSTPRQPDDIPSMPPATSRPHLRSVHPANHSGQQMSRMLAQVEATQEEFDRSRILNRVSRKREAWKMNEVIRLEQLIETDLDEPLSYSELLKRDAKVPDPQLQGRRAEDLRFKARNLKTKVLRARGTLMPRWDQVVLAKAQIEELRHWGITYDQRTGNAQVLGSSQTFVSEEDQVPDDDFDEE